MLLSLVQSSFTSSPFPYITHNPKFNNLRPATIPPLPTSFLPGFDPRNLTRSHTNRSRFATRTRASLTEAPILWAVKLCGYYALLKLGFAGSPPNPSLSDDEASSGGRKLRTKWHHTAKGTLRRKYRVNSVSEGRRLLKAIASLLSDDDYFLDASTHKGCQIRRESAHGESVCCNNVRALFDELPTPQIIVEITAFPAGPLTENDHLKAEKLERVLMSSPSI